MKESPVTVVVGVIVIGIMILILCFAGFTISNSIGDLSTLEYQQCYSIPVSDTFTVVSGGALSVSSKYYITSNNETYNLIVGSNPSAVQKFRNINGSIEVKTYKSYAGFCDYKLMGV